MWCVDVDASRAYPARAADDDARAPRERRATRRT